MKIFDGVKKAVKRAMGNEQQLKEDAKEAKLQKWKKKLETALGEHTAFRSRVDENDMLYHGTHEVSRAGTYISNRDRDLDRDVKQVVNIVFQMVESQIDHNIPQPNILPMEQNDEAKAKMIEGMLTYKVNSSAMERINDENERIAKKASVCWYKLGWNPRIEKHTFTGDFEVINPHPKNVIPQPGVYRVSDMDYLFHIETRTNSYVARTYGKDIADRLQDETAEYEYLEQSGRTEPLSTDTNKVSVVECWYKDDEGNVGLFVWANDVIIKDMPKFYFKRDEQGNVIETETITKLNPDGSAEEVTVQAYVPKSFPFVLQYNIPVDKSLYGKADPEIIKDQQEAIKKVLTFEEERILKGTTKIITQDEKLAAKKWTNAMSETIYTDKPVDQTKAIDLKTPDNSYKDYYLLMTQAAKDVMGIQDAFMGKKPSDAMSGRALQQLAQNAAQRVNSKTNGKRLAFKELYKLMVDFMLAFYEEDRPYRILGQNNQFEYGIFSRSEMLKKDAAGEYFYPEFDITIDVGDGMPKDKMFVLDMALDLYAKKAMDDIDLWTILENIGFPKASEIKERHAEMREQPPNQGGNFMQSMPPEIMEVLGQLPPEEAEAYLQQMMQMDPESLQNYLAEMMGQGPV